MMVAQISNEHERSGRVKPDGTDGAFKMRVSLLELEPDMPRARIDAQDGITLI